MKLVTGLCDRVTVLADGTVVETVILDAGASGAWPLHVEHREIA